MPSHVIHFLHDSVVAPSPAPVLGTAFDAADVHVHDLQAGMIAPVRANRNFRGIVEGIHVRLTGIAGTSKLTIRLCADAAGDFTLVPDTEATLVIGISDSDSACAAFKVGLPLFQVLGGPGNGTLYLFAKVDGGTPTFAQSCITWME